jgi:aspartate 4-decarboxylase
MTAINDHPSADTTNYSKLSPFELKDKLIGMADEAAKTRAAVMLNAGRGRPGAVEMSRRWAWRGCQNRPASPTASTNS